MPADVQLYAELRGVRGLVASAQAVVGEASLGELRASLARELSLDAAEGGRLLDGIESLHVGGRRTGDNLKIAASVVFADAQPMRNLLASGRLVDHGAVGPHGRGVSPRGATKATMVWFDGARLLVTGDAPMVEAVTAVVEGRAPALAETQRAGAAGERRPAMAFVAPSLLDALVQGQVSFASPLEITYDRWEGGYRGAFRTSLAARGVSAQSLPVPPPRPLAIARLLPAETAGYVALSTGIPGGRQGAGVLLTQILALTGREGDRALEELDGALATANLRLAEVVGSLGGEGVVAVAVRPGVTSQHNLESGYAVVLLQEVADPRPAERLLKASRDKLAALPKKAKVHAEGTGFSADLLGSPLPFVRARVSGGRLALAVGQRNLVERAFAALDKSKGRLADDAAHTRALSGMPASSLVRLWLDLGRALELGASSAPREVHTSIDAWLHTAQGAQRPTSALAFTAAPEGDRIRLDLDEVNGISVFAALGIFGVRAYLSKAKSAEARNMIGVITRSAVAAYEREELGPGNTVVHNLCKSAQSVPTAVPRGVKYRPSTQAGADWDTGDATTGWRCLKVNMDMPQYYRYTYSAGGPYKGLARGGPDPGPSGFEVAAEGNLDGNGVTSLFTRTGTVDAKTGMVVLSNENVRR